MQESSKRIALVTGANKGIGFEIARELAAAETGAVVLVGARDPGLGEKAAARLREEKLDARFVRIDLTRNETIAAAASAIQSEFGKLDILVNNAAIVDPADGPPSTASFDAVKRIMETNFLGTLAVTQAMLPLLRQAKAARIVNLSSGLGSLEKNADPNWDFASFKLIGYSASKAALNMLTVQLAYELRGTGIKVNSVSPGFIATDMNAHRGTGTLEEGAAGPVHLALLPQDGPTGGFFDEAGPHPW
jgi:NAD(P)-dependent dehydrogenase (short-subunit alcohol dehydrogenase family)